MSQKQAQKPVRSLQLSAGVVDAGLSSLATFVAGLVAVNVLEASEIGVYAVFFTAFTLGQVLASNLVFVPAEVVTISWPQPVRLRALSQTLRLGIGPSLVGSLAIAAATLAAAPISTADVITPLATTAALTTFLWPSQDHVRRLLHIAQRSWASVAVSSAQLVATVAAIGILHALDVPGVWIPFGSLAVANAASLLTGITLATPWRRPDAPVERLQVRELIRSGAGLLAGVGIPAVTKFGAATIIGYIAGTELLGYAESARVVAHPLLVLGTGLSYVLGPRVMQAAIRVDRAAARRIRLQFTLLVSAAAAGYLALVGPDWAGNPMLRLVPGAYEVSGLVAASIGANLLMGLITLVIQEMTAAGRTNQIAWIGLLSAPFQLAAAATAGVTGAFSRPQIVAAGSAVRFAG
jgi:O-antigen/teichoic acid export membrane protein